MIHCSYCKSEILHGSPFVRYCAFAYCSNECLYQYSLEPKVHVWSDYAHGIDTDSEDYDSVYADVESQESQLNRSVDAIIGMMKSVSK